MVSPKFRPISIIKYGVPIILQVTIHPNGFLYIKIPELAYSRGYRRTYLIGVLARVVVDIAKVLGKPLAGEKLDFSKNRLDTNKKFNRMAANFPFKKMITWGRKRDDPKGKAARFQAAGRKDSRCIPCRTMVSPRSLSPGQGKSGASHTMKLSNLFAMVPTGKISWTRTSRVSGTPY